jgi:hypothetical protein
LIVYLGASFDINLIHPRAKGSDIEVRHGSVLTAASFDSLAGRLRHFPAIIAPPRDAADLGGERYGLPLREAARTDARVSPGQILEQVA